MPKKKNTKSSSRGIGTNMQGALERMHKMREEMLQAQEEVAAMSATGEKSGVTVTVSGGGQLLGVKLDKTVFETKDADILEELIILAFDEARAKMEEITQEKMGPYANLIQGL